jgi:DNA-binding NarL/FixJ family response regulator
MLVSSSLNAARSEADPPGIRVLIADETSMGCQLLKNVLTRSRFRVEVVACVTSCSEIRECMDAGLVDVAVISQNLRGGPFAGFQALNELHASFPSVRVIVLLKSAMRDLVIDAFRAGAKGVVCKTDPIRVLCKCIQTVHKGQVWANSRQLHFILEALTNSTPLRVVKPKGQYLLMQREEEVANLIAEGMTNEEIAQKLRMAENAVSHQLSRIYEKLGISSRVELVLYFIQHKQSIERDAGNRS